MYLRGRYENSLEPWIKVLLEEEHCRPVVGEVLGRGTGCACCRRRDVCGRVHGDIEGIASNDLVDMCRRDLAGVD